jgi:leader peptidase (prepilin peptidase)/N-methyltransferase
VSTLAAETAARWGTAWRRPLTAAVVVAGSALAVARFGPTAHGALFAFVVAVLVVLSAIDLERRILPNALVLPAAAIVLTAHVALDPARATEWTLAAVAAAGVLFILFLVNPAGMGMGDVKLALLLGAALGSHVMAAMLIASLSVWPIAVVMFARRGRAARKLGIPFGPFLSFGAILVVFLGAGA